MIRRFGNLLLRNRRQFAFSEVPEIDYHGIELSKMSQEAKDQLAYKLDFGNINLNDYTDLSSKIKKDSGYSMLEVEPFPRQKIMKLGLIILKNLEEKIPEDAMYRIYMGK